MDGRACCVSIRVMDEVTRAFKEIKACPPLTSIIKKGSAYFLRQQTCFWWIIKSVAAHVPVGEFFM